MTWLRIQHKHRSNLFLSLLKIVLPSKFVFFFNSFYDGLLEPYFLLSSSLFTLRLSYLKGMFKFCQATFKASGKSWTCFLFSDVAFCSSQSEPTLYVNFIIIIITSSGTFTCYGSHDASLWRFCSVFCFVDSYQLQLKRFGDKMHTASKSLSLSIW